MQQRSEKTAEPSMEAILASIRKIIAEEPAPQKLGAAPAPSPDRLLKPLAPSPLAATRPAIEPPTEGPRAAVPPVAPVAASVPQSRLSDMMRELAPSAVPVGAAPAPAPAPSFHDDLADLVEGDEPAAPVLPSLSSRAPAPPFEPAMPKFETQQLPPMPAAAATSAPPAGPSRHADLGAFIPSTAEPIGMTAPRPKPLSIGADLRREPASEPPAPPVLDLGAAPLPTARREAEPPFAAPLPVLPDLQPEPEPAFAAEDLSETALTPAVAQPPTEPGAATVSDGDPMAAAQSALGALALGLAAPPTEMAVVPAPRTDAATVESAMSAEVGRKSLDDTIVDMLRPMIRDWLDDNLPEMVKKALTEELVERARSGR